MNSEQVVKAISNACDMLINPMTPHGLALRQAVAQRQGHHPEVIERGLRDTFTNLEENLQALARSRPQETMIDSQALVLAGNVFTLSFRPLTIALLAGVRTRIKPASPGDPFTEFFWSALTQADPEVGGLLEVARFASDDDAALTRFLADAQHVSVYGQQRSIDALSARLNASQTLSKHGPGFGAIVLTESDLIDLAGLVEAIARDITAYDQAGCLSPHVIWLEDEYEQAVSLAEALNVALDECSHTVAHQIATETAIDALRWRAAATGDHLIGDRSHAIWLRRDAEFRPSPGQRHITIAACTSAERQAVIDQAGSWLKAVATTTGRIDNLTLDGDAPARVSVIGQMQAPPLDSMWDGRSLWDELVR